MMMLRGPLIAVALLTQWPVPAGAANNFWCSPIFNFCGCDLNKTRDCELMRKNCAGGTIRVCSGTTCYCPVAKVGLRIGTPPNQLPNGLKLSPILSKVQTQ